MCRNFAGLSSSRGIPCEAAYRITSGHVQTLYFVCTVQYTWVAASVQSCPYLSLSTIQNLSSLSTSTPSLSRKTPPSPFLVVTGRTRKVFTFRGLTNLKSSEVKNCALLGYYAASSGNFLPTFRYNLLEPGRPDISGVYLKFSRERNVHNVIESLNFLCHNICTL